MTWRQMPVAAIVMGSISLAGCEASVEPTGNPNNEAASISAATIQAPEPGVDPPPLLISILDDDTARSLPEVLIPREGLLVSVDVADLDGGEITVQRDAHDHPVLRFPIFTASPAPGRAIVRVTPAASAQTDPLAPGTEDFAFGARFSLDAESQGTEVNGGNNLVQRGLASDQSQYKIDVDNLRPLCRVQGSDGLAEARSSRDITPEVWHRVTCTRQGGVVELTVEEEKGETYAVLETVSVEAPTGDLSWQRRETPLSIGGKLAANGEVIASATDQFNGQVADVVLQIED